MRYFTSLLICWVVFAATGCATMIRGTTQTIPVQATPEAVSLNVNGLRSYTTQPR